MNEEKIVSSSSSSSALKWIVPAVMLVTGLAVGAGFMLQHAPEQENDVETGVQSTKSNSCKASFVYDNSKYEYSEGKYRQFMDDSKEGRIYTVDNNKQIVNEVNLACIGGLQPNEDAQQVLDAIREKLDNNRAKYDINVVDSEYEYNGSTYLVFDFSFDSDAVGFTTERYYMTVNNDMAYAIRVTYPVGVDSNLVFGDAGLSYLTNETVKLLDERGGDMFSYSFMRPAHSDITVSKKGVTVVFSDNSEFKVTQSPADYDGNYKFEYVSKLESALGSLYKVRGMDNSLFWYINELTNSGNCSVKIEGESKFVSAPCGITSFSDAKIGTIVEFSCRNSVSADKCDNVMQTMLARRIVN